METVMIVSRSEKHVDFLLELLGIDGSRQAKTAATCEEARRLISVHTFDLCVIDTPLPDGAGETLARHVAARTTGLVILMAAGPLPDGLEEEGILVLEKPGSRALYAAVFKTVRVTLIRLQAVRKENRFLKGKMEDLRLVDRAKCILISHLRMSEQEAHRYIEKQAMDRQMTKRAVAEGILRTYEN